MMSHKEATRQALADARIEGYEPTAEDMKLWDAVADGTLSCDDCRRIATERAQERDKIARQRAA
jgi:hypothetical protein